MTVPRLHAPSSCCVCPRGACSVSSLELAVTLWPFKPCGSKLCLTADKQCLAGIHRHPFLGDAEPFTHPEHLHLCPSRASPILTGTASPTLQTLLPGHAPSAQVPFNRIWMCCERARIATTKLIARVHCSIGPGFCCVCIISGSTGHVSWCELIVTKEKLYSSWMHNAEPLNKPNFTHHQSNAPSWSCAAMFLDRPCCHHGFTFLPPGHLMSVAGFFSSCTRNTGSRLAWDSRWKGHIWRKNKSHKIEASCATSHRTRRYLDNAATGKVQTFIENSSFSSSLTSQFAN